MAEGWRVLFKGTAAMLVTGNRREIARKERTLAKFGHYTWIEDGQTYRIVLDE